MTCRVRAYEELQFSRRYGVPALQPAEHHVNERENRGTIQGGNYNERVFAVRYLLLAALVLWLGSASVVLAGGATDAWLAESGPLGYACGGTMLVCLFVLKFVGPPPQTFPLRAGLVSAMLISAVVATTRRAPMAGAAADALIGLALLAWYARE